MNPGKIVHPYRPVDNLRIGPHFHLPEVKTYFHYPGCDEGSFARATLRCIGVGKCRRQEGGTMCPSYMVTRDEEHCTRGRAHLLFEMLQGQLLKHGWKNKAVKESLDLCLACKGCKTECPMNVDIATYKAEFLAHYYKGRLRPRSAYAFGWIYWWARLAALTPRLTNFLTSAPFLSHILKWLAGSSQKRIIPKVATETFTQWFCKREPRQGQKVMLWPDTFTNHFHPEIGKSAVEVLEKLGFEVTIPKVSLCCGRPLYDYGMLDVAKKLLKEILTHLKEEIDKGTPIIGLEPSCVSVFRDELGNLFPDDLNAKRLKDQTYLLSEFIQKYAKEYTFKPIGKKALVHGHCHHKTVLEV